MIDRSFTPVPKGNFELTVVPFVGNPLVGKYLLKVPLVIKPEVCTNWLAKLLFDSVNVLPDPILILPLCNVKVPVMVLLKLVGKLTPSELLIVTFVGPLLLGNSALVAVCA